MRHSPTAYKYAPLSTNGFYWERRYGSSNASSLHLESAKAFGLKVVMRSAFMADATIPKSVRRALPQGQFVIYLPTAIRTLLLAGDQPTTLCAMACDVLNHRSVGA